MPAMHTVISGTVEGDVDEAVLRSLIRAVDGQPGPIYGKQGKYRLKQQIRSYNQAAFHQPWCVLVDLDYDADCAPALLNILLPEPAPGMCLRIVVREVEAWLMADRERLCRFLSIGMSRISDNVESIPKPKETMVNLARHSRSRAIRQDMVPRESSGRAVGPGYTARLIEFVTDEQSGWRPLVAADHSESLRRCLNCLQRLIENYGIPN